MTCSNRDMTSLTLRDLDEWHPPLFHLESEDYFGTLATIVSLLNERIKEREKETLETARRLELEIKVLERLKQDLVYLQKHYSIVPKDQKN